jgi:hypothetical protein
MLWQNKEVVAGLYCLESAHKYQNFTDKAGKGWIFS